MRPVRVLHVTTTGRLGGAERLLLDMARTRPVPKVDIEVCTLLGGGDLASALARDGIECHSLGIRGVRDLRRGIGELVRLIRSGGYDIVHTHLVHGAALGNIATRLARVGRPVMTRHYAFHVAWYGTPLDRALDRVSLRSAERVFAISRAVARTLTEHEGVPASKVEVIPNGIDPERVTRLAAAAPTRDGTVNGVLRAGTVGSLHSRKGHAYLLHALFRLVDVRPRLTVMFVGEGPLRSELERMARELALSGSVRFVGYTPDPYGLMAGLDIYVQPSVEEGFGIAVLEAMALARPVVASAAGGLPEIVTDGVHGILVRPADAEALANGLRRLAGDPDERRELGGRAAERVRAEFHSALASQRYLAAYERLLS